MPYVMGYNNDIILNFICKFLPLLFNSSQIPYHSMSLIKASFGTTAITNTPSISKQRSPKKKTNRTFILSASKSVIRFGFQGSEDNIEMLKISLKKQTDRRNKLKKLLEVYENIYAQQKKHVKQIKSAIIEMKDATNTCKLKLLVDPTILVQNCIKVETREFLCALLNTFYRAYEKNEENNRTISSLNNQMSFLIKGISFNEDMIFRMQKTQINEQVTLQGELLAEKNKTKEESSKKKQIKEVYQAVKREYEAEKEKYLRKKAVIAGLENSLKQSNEQSESMSKKIQYQENMRDQWQDKIEKEILHQMKLGSELSLIKNEVEQKNKLSKKLLKNLYDKRVENANIQLKKSLSSTRGVGQLTRDKIRFETTQQFSHIRG